MWVVEVQCLCKINVFLERENNVALGRNVPVTVGVVAVVNEPFN